MLNLRLDWHGPSIKDAWQSWLSSHHLAHLKALPLTLIWGIYLAQNTTIFQEKASPTEVLAKQGLDLLSFFPQIKDALAIHVSVEDSIDHSFPWDFFDGASQEHNCGGGATLFLTQNHHFKIQMGLGEGTNNYVELLGLKLLLCFALAKGYKCLQIFGDSLIVIN